MPPIIFIVSQSITEYHNLILYMVSQDIIKYHLVVYIKSRFC